MPRARLRSSASASLAPRCAASSSSLTASGSGTAPSSPSFSLAMPRFMASVASRTCAPSCRSRSSRRSIAAESSTARALACSRSATRWASLPGPSMPRMNQRSAVLAPLANHGLARIMATPAAKTANVPGNVATHSVPNGVSAPTGPSRTPGGWLRKNGHQKGYIRLASPAAARNTAYSSATATGSFTSRYAAARQPGPSRSVAASHRAGPRPWRSGGGPAIRSPSSRATSPRCTTASRRAADGTSRQSNRRRNTTPKAENGGGGAVADRAPASSAASSPSAGSAATAARTDSPSGPSIAQNASSRRARPVTGARSAWRASPATGWPGRLPVIWFTAGGAGQVLPIRSLSPFRVRCSGIPAGQQPGPDAEQHHRVQAQHSQPGPGRQEVRAQRGMRRAGLRFGGGQRVPDDQHRHVPGRALRHGGNELRRQVHPADQHRDGGRGVPDDGAEAEAEQPDQAEAGTRQQHRAEYPRLGQRGGRDAVPEHGTARGERDERGGLPGPERHEPEHGGLRGQHQSPGGHRGQRGADHPRGVFAGHHQYAEDPG